MPAARLQARLDGLIWVLIYGGLFVAVLGFASRHDSPATGLALMVVGAATSAVGVVLIWVRSRLSDDA